MPKLINLNNSQLNALKHDGKNQAVKKFFITKQKIEKQLKSAITRKSA